MTRNHCNATLGPAMFVASGAGCMHARTPATAVPPDPAPDLLKVPDTQVLVIAARGAGFQIHECQAGKDLGRHYAARP